MEKQLIASPKAHVATLFKTIETIRHIDKGVRKNILKMSDITSKVWDCPAEAKLFNPNIGKLDPKKVSCHLIGHHEKSKEYRGYASEEAQIESDPTSFEEAMRSENSSKWLKAMKVEIKSVYVTGILGRYEKNPRIAHWRSKRTLWDMCKAQRFHANIEKIQLPRRYRRLVMRPWGRQIVKGICMRVEGGRQHSKATQKGELLRTAMVAVINNSAAVIAILAIARILTRTAGIVVVLAVAVVSSG
uniref:Uncharacterized protein n=1 Tax=Oryza brachyantha TaxID=4533 RepID=J3N1G7_ORYBR